MFSFEILGAGREQVFAFMDALDLIQPATSLGDIYSLVLYPAISSQSDTQSGRTGLVGYRRRPRSHFLRH